jgi:hypothetical protein
MYRLVGGPLLGIVKVMVDEPVYRLVDTMLLVVVGVVALAIIVRLFRSAGRLPGLVVLLLGWGIALVLPTTQIDLSGAPQTIASVTQLVVGGGVIVLAMTNRAAVAAFVGGRAVPALGRVLVEARPGISPEQAEASRKQLTRLIAVLVDFGYLARIGPLARSAARRPRSH